MTPIRDLTLWCGPALVGKVKNAFYSDETWYGICERAIELNSSPLAPRIVEFIEFCEAAGDRATAKLYRESIQPDEEWHVRLGRMVLEKYAVTPELKAQARKAVEAVLDLAVKIQTKQVKEMKVSHAPGC